MKRTYITLILMLLAILGYAQEVRNFSKSGQQATRFDQVGNAVDAHDGEIAYFGGTYYLYGTSYDCGFEWNNKTAPFCGFKVYTSKDMVNWKDEGFLFDAQNPLWQSRCDGKTYGCFRPHVVYNKKKRNYVLWINVYDNVSGYRVFTSKKPTGPFVEVPQPQIAVNKDKPAAGLNNGDHDLFVDDDGICYLAITDWRAKGAIIIEQLTDDYLSGTGKLSTQVTAGNTEAPGMFKRKGIYYITYSDPNCGYCAGTGTSYKTAKSPLGPWSEGRQISDKSCGGQPSFVSVLELKSETIYLYGSDLWNNAAKNEALANFYWAPLSFAEDGSINAMECMESFRIGKQKKPTKLVKADYSAFCDISAKIQRGIIFTAGSTGALSRFDITTLKSGYPTQDLKLEFYEAESGQIKSGTLLTTKIISRDNIGWSAKKFSVEPGINLTSGKQYAVLLKSDTERGCFGFAYTEDATAEEGLALYSNDFGKTFVYEEGRKLKYDLVVN